jgi:triacylglycerol esterase/lipase EstA (alpha/beta hydrolase family)
MISFIILFINLIIINSIIVNEKTPILLVPGFAGSKLIENNKNIWTPKLNDILFNKKTWKEKLMITKTYNKNIKTLEFGDKKALDLDTDIIFFTKKNIYKNIIDKYQNIYPIPYDFRIIHYNEYLDEFYNKLSDYIISFNEPITLLCHSTGGLLIHYFLSLKDEEWKNKHIKNIININVPFGGTLITLIEITKKSMLNCIIGIDLIESFGGIILNLPNKKVIKPILLVDGNEVDYIEYFNKKYLLELTNEKLLNSLKLPNNVNTTIIYTSTKKTPTTINIINNKYNLIYGPGDGLVPINSLLYPLKWKQKNISFVHLPHYEHSSILSSKELIDLINQHKKLL